MYLDFFKFKREPFHITPDPEFLFLSRSHQEASASIYYGIEQRKGFIAITGEVGVGKTTILRSYLEGTDPERIKIIYIFNSTLTFKNLLKQILSELGLDPGDHDPSELIVQLFEYLIQEYKKDRNVVLIIDEAQNMSVETLEQLRMLSNLETSRDKLVQIVLVGQPEFEKKLELNELRQLKQRVAIRCRIDALSFEESLAYIQHRIMKASSFHNPVFTKGALKEIIKAANGVPRTINILCDNALITAFGYQRTPVDARIVKEVVADFKGQKRRSLFRWKPAMAAAAVLVAIAGFSLSGPGGKLLPKEARVLFASVTSLIAGTDPGKSDSASISKQAGSESTQAKAPKTQSPASETASIGGTGAASRPAQAQAGPIPGKPSPESASPAAAGTGQADGTERVAGTSGLSTSSSGVAQSTVSGSETASPMNTPTASASTQGGIQDSASGAGSISGPASAAREGRAGDGAAAPAGDTQSATRLSPASGGAADGSARQRTASAQSDRQSAASPGKTPDSTLATPAAGEKERSASATPGDKEAAGRLPFSMEKASGSTRILKRGEYINALLLEVYGSTDPRIVDAFREMNPQITNLDRVQAGTLVFLPSPDKIGRVRSGQDEVNRKNF